MLRAYHAGSCILECLCRGALGGRGELHKDPPLTGALHWKTILCSGCHVCGVSLRHEAILQGLPSSGALSGGVLMYACVRQDR